MKTMLLIVSFVMCAGCHIPSGNYRVVDQKITHKHHKEKECEEALRREGRSPQEIWFWCPPEGK
jgi:hypothetical protein